MKQIIPSVALLALLIAGCSSGTGDQKDGNTPGDSISTQSVPNDSIDQRLKEAEQLVKDDTSTTEEVSN